MSSRRLASGRASAEDSGGSKEEAMTMCSRGRCERIAVAFLFAGATRAKQRI
jgi:hypothetical protein